VQRLIGGRPICDDTGSPKTIFDFCLAERIYNPLICVTAVVPVKVVHFKKHFARFNVALSLSLLVSLSAGRSVHCPPPPPQAWYESSIYTSTWRESSHYEAHDRQQLATRAACSYVHDLLSAGLRSNCIPLV